MKDSDQVKSYKVRLSKIQLINHMNITYIGLTLIAPLSALKVFLSQDYIPQESPHHRQECIQQQIKKSNSKSYPNRLRDHRC